MPTKDVRRRVQIGAVVLLVLATARVAWVADDAFVTLRTLDNFFGGYGLRWNVAERVQAFTHPLWMLLLAPVYRVTGHPFWSLITSSLALTTYCLVVLATRVCRSATHVVAVFSLLVGSRGFVDHSASGLENPLTHLLLTLFCARYLDRAPTLRSLRVMSVLAGLSTLTRLDAVFLVAPAILERAVVVMKLGTSTRRCVVAVVVGFVLPVFAWEVFSLVYYGFPFPNTAYAKVFAGRSGAYVAAEGVGYVLSSFSGDPITPLLAAAGVCVALATLGAQRIALGLGIVIYLAYVVAVGGDFMLSRFLTAPALVGACIVGTWGRVAEARVAVPIVVAALATGLSLPGGPIGLRPPTPTIKLDSRGVADERNWHPGADLTAVVKGGHAIGTLTPDLERNLRTLLEQRRIIQTDLAGILPFLAGPDVHVVDPLALGEPFLARLPARQEHGHHPGHLARDVPDGYLETLEALRQDPSHFACKMRDESLCEYLRRLHIVVRGPVWTRPRFAEILRFLGGKNQHLLSRVVTTRERP